MDEENANAITSLESDKTQGTPVNSEEIFSPSRTERKMLRRLEQRTGIPVYGAINRMTEKEQLAMLLTETHSNRNFYEAIVTMDPNFGFDNDASPATAIFKATGQVRPYQNTALHAMQTIMIDDPSEDRTDTTYVVDFTHSHCNKYELKLMRQLVNEYQDTFATHK